MPSTTKVFGIFAILIFSAILPLDSSESMRSANTLEAGKWAVSVYGAHVDHEKLEFQLGGSSLIQVPLASGATAQFFSTTNTDLEYNGESDFTALRLVWRPGYGLHYGLKIGVGDYEVRLPSTTAQNVLQNGSPGVLWGVDLGWTWAPDTPVTPAVSLGLSYSQADYELTRLRNGSSAQVPINQRFRLTEWQTSLTLSNKWAGFEPYGGLRIFRQGTILRDNVTGDEVSGKRDGFSPFVGFRFDFFKQEALVVEISGVDERIVAAGFAVGF